MTTILTHLNKEQQKAVQTTEGPVLILAGAGSGKTRVLTYRAVYLITEKQIPADNILMVTFTNKAAQEMKTRVTELITETNPQVLTHNKMPIMGTFHAFCARLLRIEGHNIGITANYLIYDTDDQKTLIKNILQEMNIDTKKVSPSTIHAIISQSKNENITSTEFATNAKGPYQQIIAQIYTEYEKKLREIGALDFDDLLTQSIHLFKTAPHILEKYQEKCKYIMVDEYQDTNHVQYILTKLLASKYKNICVVGDMSQSIYKFRGADIKNILAFEKDYPKTQTFTLEENYRSTQYILDAATAVISKNKGHKILKLHTKNPTGTPITLYEALNEIDEAYYIIRQIIKNDYLYKDVAILYRTNAQSRPLEEACIKSSIPYKLVGGIRFYERKEIKDLIAYLRLIINPNDTIALERATKIGKTKLKKVLEWQKSYKQKQTESTENGIQSWYQYDVFIHQTHVPTTEIQQNNKTETEINTLQNKNQSQSVSRTQLTTLQLLEKIIEITNYIEYINDGTEQGTARIENIQELKTVAAQYPNITQFLEAITILEGPDQLSGKHKNVPYVNAITMMTLHAAKGLEFKHVFIIGWEEGLFPHAKTLLNNNELEEERRLAYVGMTRAMQNLFLCYARSRTIYGSSNYTVISRFIADIPKKLLRFEQSQESYEQKLFKRTLNQDDIYW